MIEQVETNGDLCCACGRLAKLKRDHANIVALKRRLRGDPEAVSYIEELETLWEYAKRQGNVWRGVASAMGYEPNGHNLANPTETWLLDRIAMFRDRLIAPAQVGDARRAETGTGSVHEHAVAEGDAPNSDRTTP